MSTTDRYRRVETRVWADARFRSLSPIPPCAQGLWIWFLTSPMTSIIPGVIVAGPAGIAEQLHWPLEDTIKHIDELAEAGLIIVDYDVPMIWLPNAIVKNPPLNPNAIVNKWRATWHEIPECEMKGRIWRHLRDYMRGRGEGFVRAFLKACPEPDMTDAETHGSGSLFELAPPPAPHSTPKGCADPARERRDTSSHATPSKTDVDLLGDRIASDEEEKKTTRRKSSQTSRVTREDIETVFNHWRTRLNHQAAKLSKDRVKVIKERLKEGYTVAECCKAIDGCSKTPHNRGYNDHSTAQRIRRYDSLGLILRNGEQIERFIRNDDDPPPIDKRFNWLKAYIDPSPGVVVGGGGMAVGHGYGAMPDPASVSFA